MKFCLNCICRVLKMPTATCSDECGNNKEESVGPEERPEADVHYSCCFIYLSWIHLPEEDKG